MKQLQLYDNWRDILRYAWSVRFLILAFVFTVAEVALPFFSHAIPRNVFAVLSGVAVAGAFVSRLVAQKAV